MKMKLFILIALTISTCSVFSQGYYNDAMSESLSKFRLMEGKDWPKISYLKDLKFDSLYLKKDTITLLKQALNNTAPRLELLNDSVFQIIYDLTYDTDTKTYTDNMVLDSKKIEGKYEMMLLQSESNGVTSNTIEMSILLILKGEEGLNYKINAIDSETTLLVRTKL